MWAVRFITGPRAGEIIPLKKGSQIIGRAGDCFIQLGSSGISKHHCEISISGDKLTITDLKSSNGTFLNGVRVQVGFLRAGDKLNIGDVLFDIVPFHEDSQVHPSEKKSELTIPSRADLTVSTKILSTQAPIDRSTQVMGTRTQKSTRSHPSKSTRRSPPQGPPDSLQVQIDNYLEKSLLPNAYGLLDHFEFRQVILGFCLLIILGTTLLSVIPMVQMTNEGILIEGKKRAQSLAKALGVLNQTSILQDSMGQLSVGNFENEDGIKAALIVRQSDGMILAPASRAGVVADLPFAHTARQENRAYVKEIDSETIGASYPVGGFDSNSGEQVIKAIAIVVYDMRGLALDDSRALSLFMQTLVLALIFGGGLCYILIKTIEFPIVTINRDLDMAMRDKLESIHIKLAHKPLQLLISNINSLLSRAVNSANGENQLNVSLDRHGEVENLAKIMGFPTLILNSDGIVMGCNHAFEQIARVSQNQIQGHKFNTIPDPALPLNIASLIERNQAQPQGLQDDQIEFSGHNFKISCMGVGYNGQKMEYYLIAISPSEGGSE